MLTVKIFDKDDPSGPECGSFVIEVETEEEAISLIDRACDDIMSAGDDLNFDVLVDYLSQSANVSVTPPALEYCI